MVAGCTVTADKRTPGPAEIALAPATSLKVPGSLTFIPADESVRRMRAMGERPGAEVLGAVLNQDPQRPLMMVIFATSRDARGVPQVELSGWDLAQLNPAPMQHPSANTPPPQPPLRLSAPPPPPKNDASKDARGQKLCMRDALVMCPDERSRSCTRKEIVACD